MESGTRCIKIIDLATDVEWYYDPRSRCAQNPKSLHAHSPWIALQTAFSDWKTLADMPANSEVFIETHDKVCTYDTLSGKYIPGLNVWRKGRIIGPAIYPGRRKSQVGR
jgi:hypothetical protein